MSESREYYSRSEEYGDVYISEEVLEMIAGPGRWRGLICPASWPASPRPK